MQTAIYPGTFDPLTYGHIDLIERAARLFPTVIVAVAASTGSKTPLFNQAERLQLTKEIFQDKPQVKVLGFANLLADFAKEQNANIIIRGLRTGTDFDYEFQLAMMNRQLSPQLESLFLVPGEKYMCLSSSLVREIAALKGDVSGFVPPVIAAAMKKKFK